MFPLFLTLHQDLCLHFLLIIHQIIILFKILSQFNMFIYLRLLILLSHRHPLCLLLQNRYLWLLLFHFLTLKLTSTLGMRVYLRYYIILEFMGTSWILLLSSIHSVQTFHHHIDLFFLNLRLHLNSLLSPVGRTMITLHNTYLLDNWVVCPDNSFHRQENEQLIQFIRLSASTLAFRTLPTVLSLLHPSWIYVANITRFRTMLPVGTLASPIFVLQIFLSVYAFTSTILFNPFLTQSLLQPYEQCYLPVLIVWGTTMTLVPLSLC